MKIARLSILALLVEAILCFSLEQGIQISTERAWQNFKRTGPVLIKEIRIQKRIPGERVRKLETIAIREALEKAGIRETVRLEIVRKNGALIANLGSYSPAPGGPQDRVQFLALPSILDIQAATMEDPEPLPDDELRSCRLIIKDIKGTTRAEIPVRIKIVNGFTR